MNQVFEMHLQETPFKLISSGQKTVEMRLNNKNRDKISKGDFIVFHNSYTIFLNKINLLETHLNRVDTKATFQLIWALADESINKRPEILLKKKKEMRKS